MHPALLKLMRLRITAWCRRFITRGSVARRVLGAIFLGFMLLNWGVAIATTALTDKGPHTDPALVLAAGPLVLAALTLFRLAMASSSRAIAFTEAEVDLLFPAPFTRRQLLLFKIAMGGIGSIFFALFLSVSVMRVGASWLSTFVALLLASTFIQLAGVLAVLTRQRMGQSKYGRAMLAVLAVALVGLFITVAPSLRTMSITSAGELFQKIGAVAHDAPLARAALSPFELLIRVLIAPTGLMLLGWTAATIAMLALLLLAIFRMDHAFNDAAVAASARSAARLDRARRSGGFYLARSARLRVPRPPRLGGVGPLAWRQMTTGIRGWRSIVMMWVVMIGLLIFMRWMARDDEGGDTLGALIPLLFPVYILMTATVRLDFRADLNHMDTLKSLPLRPAAVAIGQLFTPVLLLSTMALIVAAFIAFALPGPSPEARRWVILGAALCTLPGVITLSAIDNAVFLLLPTRTPVGTAADSNAMLRQIATWLLKMCLLGAAAITIAVPTTFAIALDAGPLAALITAAVTLTADAAALVAWLTYLFDRFDPARDTPA